MNRLLIAAIVGACLAASTAFANHIDFLDEGPFSFSATGATVQLPVLGIPTASALGGQRNMSLGRFGFASASLTPVNPGADDDAIIYQSSTTSFFFLVIGQGADLNANFLDIPASTADWDRVRLNFGQGSSPSPGVTVELFSDEDGGNMTATMPFAGGDANLDFMHTSFGPGATPEFLRNIDRAAFSVNGVSEGFYVIESFNRNGFVPQQVVAVPEPGSLALIALGLFGFAALRRRA